MKPAPVPAQSGPDPLVFRGENPTTGGGDYECALDLDTLQEMTLRWY